MNIEVLKSKIHRATITQADLNYIGSIAIDENLMDAANLIENERVSIYNITNGERLDTYVIKGERGSGIISLNGAAARKVAIGDHVIIVSYASMDFEKAKTYKPSIIFPNNLNKLDN
jgi:aspartate 1-decarboxylase